MRRSGQTYHYLYDGRGSVSGLTDPGGAKVNSYTYEPFGRTATATEAVPNLNEGEPEEGVDDEEVVTDFIYFTAGGAVAGASGGWGGAAVGASAGAVVSIADNYS